MANAALGYYVWVLDGKRSVYHAIAMDDVRAWSPAKKAWVPATPTIWRVLWSQGEYEVERISEHEALALTSGAG